MSMEASLAAGCGHTFASIEAPAAGAAAPLLTATYPYVQKKKFLCFAFLRPGVYLIQGHTLCRKMRYKEMTIHTREKSLYWFSISVEERPTKINLSR